jgi:hypothetical protein
MGDEEFGLETVVAEGRVNGVSASTARMTHVEELLSVVTRKWHILKWSSNSRVHVKSSFQERPLFFQRQVTVAEMVTERDALLAEEECWVTAMRSQWVARRSK